MMRIFMSGSKMFRCAVMVLVPVLFLLHPWVASPEEPLENALKTDEELEEELKYLKAETYVITPSKIPQRIEKAPGSIYVVTDKQIRQMGARYLRDVMETVPGWYLWQTFYGGGGAGMLARGALSGSSNQILIMVNSHVVNSPYLGGGAAYQYLDLDNVKRIEFVTGSGSALYGSGAMAGIVNIITKDGEDVDGLQLTGRGGSYNTWETNALFGKTIEGLEVAAYVDYLNTEGFRGQVDQDQQSVLDQRWGTLASLAPGNMKGQADQWDAQLTMKYKGLKFDGKYIGLKKDHPFGARPILDNMSKWDYQEYYLNLSYDATVMEGLDLLVKAFRNQTYYNDTSQYFPKDSLIGTPTGPTILSDNKFTDTASKSRRTGAEAQTTYEITDGNTIVGGITFEQMEVYDTSIKGNYLPVTSGVIIPLPSVQDWPDNMIMPDKKRELWAAYVEDLWDITDDLRLTIGGRYDHYSDFGGQFSPRVGLNWDFAQNYYAKCLYGRAFRAPTFRELYDPFRGNPDLKPVTNDSYELSFGVRFLPSFSAQVTGFYFEQKDLIGPDLSGSPPSRQFINSAKAEYKGVELQMKYDFGRGTYLSMNYTYQNFEGFDPDLPFMGAWWEPKQLGTLAANIRLNRYLNLNAYLLYRGDWTRLPDDTRDDPEDYALVNATLIARNFLKELKGLEVRGSVHNLFNKEYTSPTAPGELPDDLPMPGINFFLELRYTF